MDEASLRDVRSGRARPWAAAVAVLSVVTAVGCNDGGGTSEGGTGSTGTTSSTSTTGPGTGSTGTTGTTTTGTTGTTGSAVGNAVEIALGSAYTCARIDTGDVMCWGRGEDGALGYGSTENIGDDEPPVSWGNVFIGARAAGIAACTDHTCALLEGGAVTCWGQGAYGRLGYGNVDNIGDDETPASAGTVDVGGPVSQVVVGGLHTCALLQNGRVRCWGINGLGHLGYGHTNDIGDDETPASAGDVELGGTAVQLTAGSDHTCALLDDGNVVCWGRNLYGQLGYGHIKNIGDNETPASAGPVDIGGVAVQVDAGRMHTCVLLQDGKVRCWGYNMYGQLGYGHVDLIGNNEVPSSVPPVDVATGAVVQIAAGGLHTCALLDDGTIRCWGYNSRGQLGYGHTDNIGDDETPAAAGPVDVGPGTVVQLAAGGGHTCVLLDDGNIRCWGYNASGQLGYGHTNNIGNDETPASAGDVPYK